MKRNLYNLIVNLKYYARFLRTSNIEDAVKAVQHPKDKHQGWSAEEQIKAVETCRNHNQGTVAWLKWRDKQTDITANMAFVILSREEKGIPYDLLQAITENVEKWIDNYEDNHPANGDGFDERAWQYSVLKMEIYRRSTSTTQVEVFKKYAIKFGISATETKEPWEVLKGRYKTRRKRDIKELKKRLEEPDIRVREKREIKEELNRIQKKRSGS